MLEKEFNELVENFKQDIQKLGEKYQVSAHHAYIVIDENYPSGEYYKPTKNGMIHEKNKGNLRDITFIFPHPDPYLDLSK